MRTYEFYRYAEYKTQDQCASPSKPFWRRFKCLENFFRRVSYNLGNTPSETDVKIVSCIPVDVTDLQLRIAELESQLREATSNRHENDSRKFIPNEGKNFHLENRPNKKSGPKGKPSAVSFNKTYTLNKMCSISNKCVGNEIFLKNKSKLKQQSYLEKEVFTQLADKSTFVDIDTSSSVFEKVTQSVTYGDYFNSQPISRETCPSIFLNDFQQNSLRNTFAVNTELIENKINDLNHLKKDDHQGSERKLSFNELDEYLKRSEVNEIKALVNTALKDLHIPSRNSAKIENYTSTDENIGSGSHSKEHVIDYPSINAKHSECQTVEKSSSEETLNEIKEMLRSVLSIAKERYGCEPRVHSSHCCHNLPLQLLASKAERRSHEATFMYVESQPRHCHHCHKPWSFYPVK